MLGMLIRRRMGFVKATGIIFWAIMGSAMTIRSLLDEAIKEETLPSLLVKPATQEVDENMAELLWTYCGQDLSRLKGAFSELNLCFAEESSRTTNHMDCKRQSIKNVKKEIDTLYPQLRPTLLDCIRRNSHIFHVLGGEEEEEEEEEESGSKLLYTDYLEFLCYWPDAPRRSLAEGTLPLPPPPPRPRRLRKPHPPPKDPSSPAKKHNSSKSSKKGNNPRSKKRDEHQKKIIIAVVLTAGVTFVLAGLFFLCWTRAFGKDRGAKRNDERPLLSLSMSDYSVGSSVNHGGSVKSDRLFFSSNHEKKSSFGGSFIIDPDGLLESLEERPSLETLGSNKSSQAMPPLKPPPGRASSNLPKPPPDRVEPLPPEPPTFQKPPRAMTAPPLPPPAPQPPPPIPSSGPPRPPPPAPPGSRPPPPLAAPGPKGPRPPLLGGFTGPRAARPPAGLKTALDGDGSKTKLKPFFWDKVQNHPDQSMVWDEIRSGSFQFNEEMIESLFGYAAVDKNKNQGKNSSSQDPLPQFVQILDPKKAQNLSILLRALNVTTEEVCDALQEGNELPAELIQTLLKMAPTADEELKLRLFSGEISQLGPAERFLRALVDIPFAYKRLESLLFMCTLHEEITMTKESFEALEVACKELRSSRLFLKLLEAVLKTGNRMNDGTFRGGAQAFKLDTLLKLSDVKGTDGKTTLLHFVVQEIIRSEGVRAARTARESRSFSSVKTEDLMVEETSEEIEEHYRNLGLLTVSGLSSELENVKKAANIDADNLTTTVAKMGHALIKARDFLNLEMKSSDEESGFHEALKGFAPSAEGDIRALLEEEKRITVLVKSTGDYFHGKAGKDEGLRLFVIVRDFLIMLDMTCREVRDERRRQSRMPKKQNSTASSSTDPHKSPSGDPRQRLFPAIAQRRKNNSSSDSDSA